MFNLLIVDDETVERRSLCNSLDWNMIGVQVAGDAWNGKQAIEMVMQNRPDIVITDVKMPVMDGVEMAKMIRAIDPSIKIIFCSAYEDFDYAREAANLNAFGYLLKPINDEELLQIVKRAADRCLEERMHHTMYARLKSNLSLGEPLLREAVVRNRFLGMGDEPGTLLRSIGLDWINETDGPLCLILIRWDKTMKCKPEDVKNSLEEIMESWHNAVSVKMNSQEIAIALRSYANSTDTSMLIEQASRQMLERIRLRTSMETDIQFAIYGGSTSLEEAYADISRRTKAEEAGLLVLTSSGQDGDVQPDEYARVSRAIVEIRSESFKLLHQGNIEALNRLISQCFMEHSPIGTMGLTFYCGIGFSVLSVLLDAVKKQGIDPFSRLDDEIACWTNLLQLRTIPEIERYLTDRVQHLVAKIKGDKNGAEDPFIEQVANIVKNHYQSSLSVEMVANLMHFTPNYVGAVFKSKMKISLNDYINKFRVSQSMQLLRDPSLSINDVAKMCGYENTPYFHKIFKRLAGVTPGEYRLLEEGTKDEAAH